MSDYDRSKNLGKFLHQKRFIAPNAFGDESAATGEDQAARTQRRVEKAEFDAGGEEASPTIGDRMKRLREASKMRPKTEGERAWSREQSERSSAINATRSIIGRRG